MKFEKVYNRMIKINKKLSDYTLKNTNQIENYYIAQSFCKELTSKAKNNISLRTEMYNWLNNGGTTNLRVLLTSNTTYSENSLPHFNAMSLIDSVRSL